MTHICGEWGHKEEEPAQLPWLPRRVIEKGLDRMNYIGEDVPDGWYPLIRTHSGHNKIVRLYGNGDRKVN